MDVSRQFATPLPIFDDDPPTTTRQIVGFHDLERSRSHGDEPSQFDYSQELNRIMEEDEVVDVRAEMQLEYRQR